MLAIDTTFYITIWITFYPTFFIFSPSESVQSSFESNDEPHSQNLSASADSSKEMKKIPSLLDIIIEDPALDEEQFLDTLFPNKNRLSDESSNEKISIRGKNYPNVVEFDVGQNSSFERSDSGSSVRWGRRFDTNKGKNFEHDQKIPEISDIPPSKDFNDANSSNDLNKIKTAKPNRNTEVGNYLFRVFILCII